ncbi:undecaprenyl-phosphate glucose phosphotransferase [Pontibacter korlensis]|uniref:Sugar transferase n=1 Tax=Pontibacter korlensis TaxID=400092 RepID=A0A0E3ZHG7_9BACT|nr:undecaprenyl-phosphate glucose phosphotransferase [Pontibacter korlensis]AKD04453.1 sugar transferase [Pontibacter korlensis]
MTGLYSKYIRLVYLFGDLAAIAISVLAMVVLDQSVNRFTEPFYLFLCSLAAWFVCTSLLSTYKIYRVARRLKVVLAALKAVLLYILLMEAGLNITGFDDYSRKALLYHYAGLTLLVISWRVAVTTALRIYRTKGYNLRKVVIAGHNELAIELKHFLEGHPEYGYKFLGFFSNKESTGENVIGRVSDIKHFVATNEVDEIYCCPYELDKREVAQLLDFADDNLIRIKFLPEFNGQNHQRLKIDFYDILPVMMVRAIPLDDVMNKFIKRAFDIVFSLLIIVFILSWLLPIIAIAIKIDSRGPIFFKQTRSGIDNKSFQCYKLRSMYINKDAHKLLAQRGDARITRVGAFIRKTSIDELPQFFNVLLGHMSIVGPRPHMLKLGEEYAQVAEKYMVRHFIKPGITGLSQVRGYRGDTTHSYQIRGRVKLDIFYLENWSFWLDLKIIFYTVYNVIRGDKAAF